MRVIEICEPVPDLRQSAQLFVISLTNHRVALFQQALISDCLSLRVFDRYMTALSLITVKLGFTRSAPQDVGQLFGKIERVVDAAVEPHTADRAIHVRRIANENCAPGTKPFRHPLVHSVQIPAANIEIAIGRQKALKTALQRFRPRQCVLILVGVRRKMDRQRSGGPFQWNKLEYSTGSEM